MSDFRKPRADTPILPTTAIVRKVRKAPKKPKGRRGKKPKGQKSGKFVSRQDPNFLLRKADDEARKAREDRQRRTEQEERQIQLQIEDRRDRRQEARRADALGRQQLQIAQARFAQDAAVQREQLRLQGEAQQETQRFRAAQLTQQANQGAARAREAEQLRRDNFDIYGSLQRLYRQQERREGDNLQLMREFLRDQSRRVELDPAVFRGGGAEPFGSRATAEQRRLRRSRSKTPAGGGVRAEPTDVPRGEADAIRSAYDSVSGSGSGSSSSAEEVLPRSRARGSPDIPEEEGFGAGHRTRTEERRRPTLRFQGGATEDELAAAGGIEGQTPRDLRLSEAQAETTDISSEQLRGATGSSETQRRGSGAGRLLLASQLVRGAAAADARRAQANIAALGREPEPEPQLGLEESGVLITPPTSDTERERAEFEAILQRSPEAGLSESEGEGIVAPAARAVGRGGVQIAGGALRGIGGFAAGIGQGVVGQLPTAGETGAFIGRQGYRGIVAAGGLIQGGARGALAAATEPRQPAIGEQTGGTLTYQGQP